MQSLYGLTVLVYKSVPFVLCVQYSQILLRACRIVLLLYLEGVRIFVGAEVRLVNWFGVFIFRFCRKLQKLL